MIDLEELRKLLKAATPGPWKLEEDLYITNEAGDVGYAERDLILLVALRNGAEEMIEEIERLRKEIHSKEEHLFGVIEQLRSDLAALREEVAGMECQDNWGCHPACGKCPPCRERKRGKE
jgi:hypothetical protein